MPKFSSSELQDIADKLTEEVDDLSTIKQKVFRETILSLMHMIETQAEKIEDLESRLNSAERSIERLKWPNNEYL
jgi:predicted RNase H-like nuclease (RuvC/YqgF family)